MTEFMNDHPWAFLLALFLVCSTLIQVTRIFLHRPRKDKNTP
jgi:hypothetical protein